MTNGVILNVLSGEETENAISFNEEDEEKILVVIEKDIQEFKDKQTWKFIANFVPTFNWNLCTILSTFIGPGAISII